MKKELTIIIPYLNEPDNEVYKTIKSIYETTNSENIDFIIIDDNSDKKYIANLEEFPLIKHIRNKERIGVDGCRQIGIDLCETDFICIFDAHMRFKTNWDQQILCCLKKDPNTVWCTRVLGLGYGNMDINHPQGNYNGATMLFVNNNIKPERPAREILEPKWLISNNEIEYEIPCVLGANYAFSKKWAEHIRGLRGLKMWGTSEPFLSMKTWLAGGKCKIRTDIEIGHKFRDNAPYCTETAWLMYNKIFLCKTILPEELGEKLISYMPRNQTFRTAMRYIDKNINNIKEEKKYYENIFKVSIYDYCKKFNIELPS